MKGLDVKKKLVENGFLLSDVAKALKETPQNLDSMLRAEDIKTGVLEKIAKAINKSLYFFIEDDKEKPIHLNSRFEDQLDLYKENAEFYKQEIRGRLEKIEVSLAKLTEYTERISAQNHTQDILSKMSKLADQVQALAEAANFSARESKAILQRKRESQGQG